MRLTRKQFEEAVRGSDLNPYARLILLTYAGKAGYTDKVEEVWPSMAWVSEATGINKDIVSKYVKALVKDGWLIPAQIHGRAQGYYLAKGLLTVRTLEKAKRKSNLLMESDPSPDGAGTHLLMESEVSPDGQELITMNNQLEVNKEEPKTEPVAPEVVADAPTHPLVIEQEDWMRLEDVEPPFDKDELERFRVLTSFAAWGSRMSISKAIALVIEERSKEPDPWD